ncbi:ABC transporter substrate-binding protein [Devosia sp. LC5]|uniref:ABC transporter substrate-binding protein n=1 Tax=Devosia sp. LC5 TaxID=1502724 RepID=UPI0004E44D9E|nr:ABC transporter substrate-binding protein [Devosia sp. LC5]KFC64535.1 ABC transporter substrate-binding protein [Devosia sp. LC5]
MTKSILLGSAFGVLIAFGAALSMAAPAVAQDAECPAGLPLATPGKLTMSINATIPPKQYINADGELVGLHVDLGNEIAKRLCLEPEFMNVAFEVQIPGLQTKRWDMINTGLYYTDERAKIMQLIPYTINALALIVADGNPLGVATPEDLAGKVVGVEIAGFEEKKIREINDEQVAKGLAPMDIRVFNTYGDTFLALGAGQIEAVFAGDAIGKYYQEQGKFTMAVTGLYPGSPGVFATIEPAIADAIVVALNSMLEDGTYNALMDRDGATKIETWPTWEGRFAAYFFPE